MLKKTVGVLVALALTACSPVPEVDFQDGLPGREATEVRTPAASGQGLEDGTARAQAAGDVSGTWLVTVAATAVVNGGTLFALGALSWVADGEPTSIRGDVAVFGPHTPALSPTTWRMTMTRTAPNAFDYVLEGKQRGADDATYKAVITGQHTVAIDAQNQPVRGFGEGAFTIQWDAAAQAGGSLPGKTGSATFRYARDAADAAVSLAVDLQERAATAGARPVTAKYRYAQAVAGEGSFEWGSDTNLQPGDATYSALERFTMKSRWTASGAGRADLRSSGGDLTLPVTWSECWDGRFRSTYLRKSDVPSEAWGTEAQACVYTSASFVQE
jgi:hypothetical protein